MKTIRQTAFGLIIALSAVAAGCAVEPGGAPNTNAPGSPSPSASPSPSGAVSKAIPVTLPVLDALFSDEAFKSKLKSQVQLNDDQLAQLQKIAADEVARLRQSNAEEQTAEQLAEAQQSRERAAAAIRGVIGEQKAEDLFALARDYWVKGNETLDAAKTTAPADTLLPGPNAVPTDTRVVVNIPAFRMDVFQEGSLVKSYKIGIGYPAFPLPTGLRKAQTIIFNPTWTPPDEPWVAKMKNVSRRRKGGGRQQTQSAGADQDSHRPAVVDSWRQVAGKTRHVCLAWLRRPDNGASSGLLETAGAGVRDANSLTRRFSHTSRTGRGRRSLSWTTSCRLNCVMKPSWSKTANCISIATSTIRTPTPKQTCARFWKRMASSSKI